MWTKKKSMLVLAACTAIMTTAARAYTQHQKEVCQADAIRLCGPVIPDHAKIHACLKHYRHHISHACRAII